MFKEEIKTMAMVVSNEFSNHPLLSLLSMICLYVILGLTCILIYDEFSQNSGPLGLVKAAAFGAPAVAILITVRSFKKWVSKQPSLFGIDDVKNLMKFAGDDPQSQNLVKKLILINGSISEEAYKRCREALILRHHELSKIENQ